MDGFTIIDGIVAAVIILSAILAYARGFVRESLAILGWIGAAVLAFLFAATVRPMIAQVPVLEKFLGESCELATIAAFAVVSYGLIGAVQPLPTTELVMLTVNNAYMASRAVMVASRMLLSPASRVSRAWSTPMAISGLCACTAVSTAQLSALKPRLAST